MGLFILFVASVACLSTVRSSPVGAPALACTDMTPQHGVPTQDPATSPYVLGVTTDGTTYTVTVSKASSSSPDYKGLFIQARATGSTVPQGIFNAPLPTDTKFRPCPTDLDPNNGVTHSINSTKTSSSFNWTPSGPVTGVRFVATVVQVKPTFWVGIESADLGTITSKR